MDHNHGGVPMIDRLAHMLLVEILRAHLAPAEDFTQATGMSRSAFLSLFKRRVGTGPLDYLLRWRMRLAAKRLLAGKESVTTIALSLGYESESAFGHAFKRVTGHSPRSFATADFDGSFRDGRPVA